MELWNEEEMTRGKPDKNLLEQEDKKKKPYQRNRLMGCDREGVEYANLYSIPLGCLFCAGRWRNLVIQSQVCHTVGLLNWPVGKEVGSERERAREIEAVDLEQCYYTQCIPKAKQISTIKCVKFTTMMLGHSGWMLRGCQLVARVFQAVARSLMVTMALQACCYVFGGFQCLATWF